MSFESLTGPLQNPSEAEKSTDDALEKYRVGEYVDNDGIPRNIYKFQTRRERTYR